MIQRWMKELNVKGILFTLFVLGTVLVFLTAIGNLEQGHNREGKAQLEAAIRRSAVACYAAEGIYPPTIAYLEEHYGIQVDKEKYTVIYEVFAENLMPEITVLEKDYERTDERISN